MARRRGPYASTAVLAAAILLDGEEAYDTGLGRKRVGDGATAGGRVQATKAEVDAVSTVANAAATRVQADGIAADVATKASSSTVQAIDSRLVVVEGVSSVGIKWITQNIRVRSTANVALATGLTNGTVLNGVTLATGEYVFLGSQTAPAENGIYTVVASGAASRATFADSAAELSYIGFLVGAGTVGIGERYTLPLASSAITLGTTALSFAMVGIEVTSAAEVVTARNGEANLATRLASIRAEALNELDLQANTFRPLFVLTNLFTKSYYTAAAVETITIVTRDSATQFTVAAGKGALLPAAGAVVVYDATAIRYYSFGVKSVAGDVITVHGTLPAVCSTVQTMHAANNDQHLGRHGYNGLADFIVEQSRKYSYRKDARLFTYHPPVCTTPAFNDPDIYDRATGLTKLIDVTALGGAVGGGYVAGTTDLGKACSTSSADVGNGPVPLGQIMPRFYDVTDNGVGKGIEMSFDAAGVDGVIQIGVSAARLTYDTTMKTEGKVRLEVTNAGVSIHNQTYDAGVVNLVNVDFTDGGLIVVRMTCAEAVPTAARLHYVYAWQKAPTTPTAMFQNGDVIAFLGDSWTQFPAAVGAEVLPTRPDGVTAAEGMQFLSERLRTRLAATGVTVKTRNWGKSGTTSAWGLYWVNKVIADRPTHCVINFAINDNNSAGAPTSTAYDFHPTDMWTMLPVTSGGVDGKVLTAAAWEDNMRAICDRLIRAGITPIVLLPPDTGSSGQAYSLQQNYLPRLSAGFETPL